MEVSVITDRYEAAMFAATYHFGLWVISPRPARAIARSLATTQLMRYNDIEQHYATGKKLRLLNITETPFETED